MTNNYGEYFKIGVGAIMKSLITQRKTGRATAVGAATLALALLGGGLKSAQAAHWELTYKAEGENREGNPGTTGKWTYGDPQTGEFQSQDGINIYSLYSWRDGDSNGDYPAFSTYADGKVTVVLTWTKDDDEETLPEAPEVVSCWVSVEANAGYTGQDSDSIVTVDVGSGPGIHEEGGEVVDLGEDGSDYTPDVYAHGKSAWGSYLMTVPVPAGQTKVEVTLPLLAKVESHEGNSPLANGAFNGGQQNVHAALQATYYPRGVVITSNLEPSYQKVTDAGALPRTKDANGNWVVDTSKLRDPNSYPGAGPWAVAVQRQPSGKINTHSAARWYKPGGGDFQAWLGGDRFEANVVGFTNPTYAWSVTGGEAISQNGSTQKTHDLMVGLPNPLAGSYYGIKLGSQPNASDLVAASTVKVDVTDSNGTLSNTYNINWHKPTDNWKKINTTAYPKLIFPKPGFFVDSNNQEQTVIEPNRTFNFEIPAPVVEFNYKNGLTTGRVVLGVAGAGVGIWAVAAGTAAAAMLGAEITLGLTVAAGVTSIVAGNIPDPTLEPRVADYAEYKANMRLQKEINDARAADPNAHPDT
ncbi:MAG: hypothetical protein M3347_12870, partial [Armatimonadota bacterium]|nr:hypothetical protein [Armatimonadota bacterium]